MQVLCLVMSRSQSSWGDAVMALGTIGLSASCKPLLLPLLPLDVLDDRPNRLLPAPFGQAGGQPDVDVAGLRKEHFIVSNSAMREFLATSASPATSRPLR